MNLRQGSSIVLPAYPFPTRTAVPRHMREENCTTLGRFAGVLPKESSRLKKFR